jgi:hypothetical protein
LFEAEVNHEWKVGKGRNETGVKTVKLSL